MTNPTSTTIQFQNLHSANTTRSAAKRQKLHHHGTAEDHHHHHQSLLPGLPDHIAQLCLSLVPPSTLYPVCHSWRRLIYSPSFPPFLSLYSLFVSTEAQPHLSSSIHFCSFDPISCQWQQLPPPADPPLRLLFRHPSFISRKLPIQSVAVSGKLVVLAATVDQFLPALTRPILFDPVSNMWTDGPPFCTPRRWCAAGASRGIVFVASGIGAHYNTSVARSVEKWDLGMVQRVHLHQRQKRHLNSWGWEKLGNLRDGKFSRDAIDAIGWKGKLCMVNVKGDAAKDGIIYDVGRDCWEDMPEGMLSGWRGPAAAMEEETIYAVDESSGSLKRYDHVRDAWVEVVEDHDLLKGAQQVVAAGGKVCVLSSDGFRVAVVDVAEPAPERIWVVEAPPGLQAVAIHALPRLSHPDILSK